jgi:heme/copper-type cytochrome/quinol oxidase subunit 1
MRRFGIYLYFLGTVVAQIIVTLQLRKVAVVNVELSRLVTIMLWLVALPFALGLLNLLLKATLADPDMSENRIEWIAALMMQAWFVVLYLAWRRTGFRVSVSVDPTSAR